MYTEDQLRPISALQHLIFCERQCALIHIEGLWAENRLTVEGRQLHNKAHEGPNEWSHDADGAPRRVVRGLPLVSFTLGLFGLGDVIEFGGVPRDALDAFVRELPQSLEQSDARAGLTAFPVEYKRGRPKRDASDRVQVCAQAMCLEEMLDVRIPQAALYYARTRRRLVVSLDAGLRETTAAAAHRLHQLLANGVTPRTKRMPKCRRCSLLHQCLPEGTGPDRSVSRYVASALQAIHEPMPEEST